MIRFLSHYKIKHYMVYRVVLPEDNTITSGINVVSYIPGFAIFNDDKISLTLDEELFFQQLHKNDVIEVMPNGIARLIYDTTATDNTLFFSSMCNSNCLMCPSSQQSRKLGELPNIDTLTQIINHYPNHLTHITITGGEPLLIGDQIGNIFLQLKDKDSSVQCLLLTNGRAFCLTNVCEAFNSTAPYATTIAIPIHGPNCEIHDLITQSKGSFSQTVKGIHNLLQVHRFVEIRIVISRLNISFLQECKR